MSKVLIAIDIENCFVQGGTLGAPFANDIKNNTGSRMTGKKFTELIDRLIKTGGFSDVYFTKDVHSVNHASFQSEYTLDPTTMKATSKDGKTYKYIEPFGKGGGIVVLGIYNDTDSRRTWKKKGELTSQFLWPDHCIKPQAGNNTSKTVNRKANRNDFAPLTQAEKNALLKPISNTTSVPYGHNLAHALAGYEDANRPSGVPESTHIHIVEKGFEKRIDSYSAIADAEGNYTPRITNSTEDGQVGETLLDSLSKKDPKDVYICGIARDFCVYYTALDLLNFWQPLNPENYTVHFLYDLTKEIFPKSIGEFEEGIKGDIQTLQSQQRTVNFKLEKGFTLDTLEPVLTVLSLKPGQVAKNITENAVDPTDFLGMREGMRRGIGGRRSKRHTKKHRSQKRRKTSSKRR
jgi:nicotinamidase-related amidase